MTSIQNISIPKACHQSWQQMTPVEQGRHCQQCCKTVTDFTVMSNQEIIAYLATTHDVCGRFDQGQLSSLNNRLDIENLQPNSWRRWVMVIGLLSQTMFYKAVAQTKPSEVVTQQTKPVRNNEILGKVAMPDSTRFTVIKGQVLDTDKQPIPGVIVKVKGSTSGTQTMADGKFVLSINKPADVLGFSFIGFDSQEIKINSSADQFYHVIMKENTNRLTGEVVVVRRLSFVQRTWYKIKRIF